jgi:hypothetical protein
VTQLGRLSSRHYELVIWQDAFSFLGATCFQKKRVAVVASGFPNDFGFAIAENDLKPILGPLSAMAN